MYGEAKCDECTQGKFVNARICDSCGAGQYGKPNLEAKDRTSESVACKECPRGTYSTAMGAAKVEDCNKCAAGKMNPHEGSNSSSDCVECNINTKAAEAITEKSANLPTVPLYLCKAVTPPILNSWTLGGTRLHRTSSTATILAHSPQMPTLCSDKTAVFLEMI